MMISTYTITQEYLGCSLVISVLDTDRGGTTFSTVSAVQEIAMRVSGRLPLSSGTQVPVEMKKSVSEVAKPGSALINE